MIPLIVTDDKLCFPYGVLCRNCKRPIENGEPYKNRDVATGKLSTGPYTEDRTDGVFCVNC